MFISTSRAFGFWLDLFCVVYIAVVTISFFVFGGEGGNVGLAITQALAMTGMVQWGMRQSAELENTMTAVERVVEYESVDPEDELEAEGEYKPPPEWPQQGEIIFDKLSLRYFPDSSSDLVLKELDFDIKPMEKVKQALNISGTSKKLFLPLLLFFFLSIDWNRRTYWCRKIFNN